MVESGPKLAMSQMGGSGHWTQQLTSSAKDLDPLPHIIGCVELADASKEVLQSLILFNVISAM